MPKISFNITAINTDVIEASLRDAHYLLEGKIDTDNVAHSGGYYLPISLGKIKDLPQGVNYIRGKKVVTNEGSTGEISFEQSIFTPLIEMYNANKIIAITEQTTEITAKPNENEIQSGTDDIRQVRRTLSIKKPAHYQLIYFGGISGEFIFRSDTIIKNTDVPAVRADVRVSKKQDEGNVAYSVKLTTAVIDLPEETIVDMSLFYQDIDEAGKSEYVYFNARVTAYYEVVQ